MKRMAWVVAALAAIVGAFLLGRHTASAPDKVSGAASPVAVAGDASEANARLRQADARVADADADDRAAVPAASPVAPVGDAGANTSRAPGDDMQASGGPRPLLKEDRERFADAENYIRADGGTGRDLLDLSENEEQDDGARRLEQLIAQSIRVHGDHYTDLRLSPPRCTRSVCILRGIGVGATQNPRSDWQRLSSKIVNEPWWREAFDDMRGSVSSNGGDTVYLTFYVRCEPGTCRHGSR